MSKFIYKNPKSYEDKIKDKYPQLINYKENVIIVLYSGTEIINSEELFDDQKNDFGPYIVMLSKPMSVSITYKQMFQNTEKESVTKSHNARNLVGLQTALEEYEDTLLWKNQYSNVQLLADIIRIFTKYQSNLDTKLLEIPKNYIIEEYN